MNRRIGCRMMMPGVALSFAALLLFADEPRPAAPDDTKPAEPAPEGLVKLFPKSDVWLDEKRKAVVVDGQVCLREGQLEMFACPRGTKEHESIVALNCQAQD